MSLAAIDYRENPTHPAAFQKNSKILRQALIDMENKNAFVNNQISLADYFYAQAANIDYIEYLDPDNLQDELANLNINDLQNAQSDTEYGNSDSLQSDIEYGDSLQSDNTDLYIKMKVNIRCLSK